MVLELVVVKMPSGMPKSPSRPPSKLSSFKMESFRTSRSTARPYVTKSSTSSTGPTGSPTKACCSPTTMSSV